MARGPDNTDEWTDRVFSRPMAALIVAGVHRLPITPNHLTAVATLFGVGVGVAMALGLGWLAAGCTLGYLAFDCSDGQLARKRGGGGVLGRIADGVGDYLTAIAMHLGLIVWLAASQGWLLAIAWGVACGASLAWVSLIFDRYKRRHAGSEDETAAYQAARETATPLQRWLIDHFLPYVQRVTQGLRVSDHAAYRQRVGHLMHGWLWVGPSTHFLALTICCALERPLLYAWICVVGFNAAALVLLFFQRRLDRQAPVLLVPEPASLA